MAIVPRHIDPEGLKAENLDVCLPVFVGPIKASAIAAVYTKQSFASAGTSGSFAPGTNVDFARNLIYQISVTGGTASNPFSAGTLIVRGSDIRGSAISETVNIPALGSSSGISQGIVKFASLASDGLSFSGVAQYTSLTSNSNSVSFSVGVGNVVGLPNPVGSVNPIKYAYEGTSAFTNFTAVSGPVGTAGVSVTPTLGSGSNLMFIVQLNGADFRG
jgi:hypothetical protein